MSGLWIATKKTPGIWVPKHRADAIGTKEELTNAGRCGLCRQPYSWKVQFLQQKERPDTETEDNRNRAMALFTEYRTRGIGPCCAKPEHRNFIAKHSGMVTYN